MSAELGDPAAPVDAAALDDDPLKASYEAAARAPIGPLDAQRLLELDDPGRALRAARGHARRRGGGARAAARRGLSSLSAVDPDDARERLQAEQQRVEGLIEGFRAELGTSENDDTSELADYDQHPADTASETFEREKDLSILEQLENELAELQAALERVDAGTYGIDEETGEPIDPARLDALPDRAHQHRRREEPMR